MTCAEQRERERAGQKGESVLGGEAALMVVVLPLPLQYKKRAYLLDLQELEHAQKAEHTQRLQALQHGILLRALSGAHDVFLHLDRDDVDKLDREGA